VITLSIAQAKDLFFDRDKLSRAVDRGFRRGLSRMGAFIRTKMISLILRHNVRRGFGVKTNVKDRHPGQVSPPGEPPYSHEGSLAKWIFFGYDERAKAVFIGPAKLNKGWGDGGPHLLEYGGPASRTEKRQRMSDRVRQMFYRPRPFAHPALDAEMPKLPDALQGCVRAD
jgi:hypothetical protein